MALESTLQSIERRRVQLEENIGKLRKALAHYATCEAVYSAFKEGLQEAGDPSPAQIREVAQSLDSSLLDSKEVEGLLGKDASRSADQVIGLITNRIDYVQRNSTTIEAQLEAAEKQLAGVDVLLEPGVENEEGLPMMDIEEEYDEEDVMVASSVKQTGKGAAEVVELLRKAGVLKAEQKQKQDLATDHVTPPAAVEPQDAPSKPSTTTNTSSHTNPALPIVREESSQPAKKTVTFHGDDGEPATEKLSSLDELQKYGYSKDLAITDLPKTFDFGTENLTTIDPILPQDESPEDAELRRQMLQYGLSEVGNIVAELDLDHPTAEYTDEEEEDDDYEYDTEEEEEDQYGRSIRPEVTDEYRAQMMELEKKLNARMMENVGASYTDDTLAAHANEIRTLRVREDGQFDESLSTAQADPAKPQSGRKKGVRFADALDVSDAPQPVREPRSKSPSNKPAPTMTNTIVERSASQPSAAVDPSKPAKVSRFKSSRAGTGQQPQFLPTPPVPQAPAVPTGPSGRTLAATVVEHGPSSMDPKEPDEFDPVTINREMQADYHKARNRFIQQQGGFKPTQEDLESPLLEERDGKTRKVSRFMASRLNASGM